MLTLVMRKRWKEILIIAWPLVVANSFWNVQLTVDRIFLGRFSTDALAAAVGVSGVFWAPMALVQQTASYVTAFVAQLFGAKREREIGSAVWQSILVSVVGGLLFLLLIPLAPKGLALMGHPESVRGLEITYFQVMCWSALPTALVAAASGFFTGLGQSSTILWINGVGMAANALLGYVLVFGHFGFPAMGVAGAGYATVIANWLAAAVGLALVFRAENEKRYKTRSAWRFDPKMLKRFLRYGLPSGMQWALEGLAFTVFLVFVGRMEHGDAALAASGIAITLMMLAVLPPIGIAQAVSVLLGQRLGEGKPAQAEAISWTGVQVAWFYIALVGSSFVLFPEFYLTWFKNTDTQAAWLQVTQIAPVLLRFVAFFTLFDSMNLVLSFALKGAGDTRFVSLVALVLPWPLMVVPTALLYRHPQAITLAWAAVSVYGVIQAMIFLIRFRGGKWKSMSVIRE